MTIAVAHSESARGKAALHSAAEEALWRGQPLAVLRIVAGVDAPRDDPKLKKELAVELAKYAELTWDLHATAEGYDTADALLDLADEVDASLLVIGSRRRTPVGKLILGSVVQQVLLKATIPVLVVKAT